MKTVKTDNMDFVPGNYGEDCPFNGECYDEKGDLIECCCDECDYMIDCFLDGELPNNYKAILKAFEDWCYKNAKEYFNF